MSLRIYGNRQLKTLPGLATRPTPSRVREALFNIWQGTIAGCRWLDICTGSGSMGAEALCRSAATVTGIEQSAKACAIIRENWEQVADDSQEFQILRGNAIAKLASLSGQQFDRVYFDPPYASDLYEPVLSAIASTQMLALNGEIAVEHRRDRAIEPIEGLEICRQKTYGNTALTFYAVNQTAI
ncbi:MAG: 16S rRNA (guanine(966)-N(2))-methyltransferase RsmD [Oscillatoriales cyanobacterium RU_3_3]|nr:16S rRNA (guanine(966)-N(2))-methyltransferase RsmD [Microcoleus sp. SU_5_6]NJL66446.1 16S rRNA (guanine(966)-N(2))-methyltransferase RsmD [Microcoleus sp. SM1_3_4]NJM62768.1 16S rRNA (guanine(966)-N(2))-methyltransferase RsmD [Oscillatoriales cyanobacterium RU_3_3]NJR24836.1 16S rRNA (guanine(966)-N(2))-methyltransferase RsmD [Richelia sp. CSU_2_1]